MNALNSHRSLISVRTTVSALLALVFCYLMLFVQLPYYIFQPGTAENLRNMVRVEAGGYPESGSFLLTTVGVTQSNMLRLIEAELRSYDVRRITEIRPDNESNEEYGERQYQIMLTSQANAIQAAYKAAGIAYTVANVGLTVLRTAEGYPAHGILEAGDVIVSADGVRVATGAELFQVFVRKQAGDSVTVMYQRGGVIMEAAFTLRILPQATDSGKQLLGIGAVTADMKNVSADQPDHTIFIEAGEIGGPSAGFMFALEIYGLLLPEDLSKGYRIAGTGTIDTEGNIGPVGSIRHKVSAAHRAGADLFFVPKDWETGPEEVGEAVRNATEALKQARKLRSGMTVVAVGSLEEAIQYLEELPPKE